MRTSKLTNRLNRIFFIYKYLLISVNGNNQNILNLLNEFSFTTSEEEAIYKIIENLEKIISCLKNYLPKTWQWERINFLERSLLINGYAELQLFFNQKKIVINETIEIAKEYCEIKAYKLINAILDNF